MFETINANDLQARITAAIQSGSGPDIIMMLHNWPHLYAGGLADVSDLADWKAADQGGYYPHSEAAAKVGKALDGAAVLHGRAADRVSQVVVRRGRAIPSRPRRSRSTRSSASRSRRRASRSARRSATRSATRRRGPIRSRGRSAAMETDPSGKKVVLNSKGTLEAVTWMTDFWKQACDESALAWDDTNNNRAFMAGEISATLNGASIYIYAKRNPDKVKNDKGEPMWPDIGHLAIPDGPGGRTPPYAVAFSHAVMKYSKNQKAVKEFLKWFHGKDDVRQVVRDRERLRARRRHLVGEQPDVGQDRRRAQAVPHLTARHAHARATPARRPPRPPRRTRSTSSPTCTPRPPRARRRPRR